MRLLPTAVVSLVLAASVLSPTAASAASDASMYWGAYIDGAPFNPSVIDSFEADAGKHMSIVTWGQPWEMNGQFQVFDANAFNLVRNRGSIPLLTWASWQLGYGNNQPSFSLANISNGAYDWYIAQWAQAARAWGHPLLLRFDHEMNGWWYPWSEQLNGNHAGDYVRAWRHVHDIFTQQGATNVSWVWCLNEVSPNSTPTAEMYPGDSYVDWTCVDGYNWGTDGGNAWQSFSQVFSGDPRYGGHNSYQELLNVAPSKPIMIGETASTEDGGPKASWITDMLQTQLPTRYPQVKAFIWFNWTGPSPGLSWPIESSYSAKTAFAQGIASSVYAGNDFASLNTTGVQPLQAVTPPGGSAPPSGGSGGGGGGGNTLTLTPAADTYTMWFAPYSASGGSATELSADGYNTYTAFLRFDLSQLAGRTIKSAALR